MYSSKPFADEPILVRKFKLKEQPDVKAIARSVLDGSYDLKSEGTKLKRMIEKLTYPGKRRNFLPRYYGTEASKRDGYSTVLGKPQNFGELESQKWNTISNFNDSVISIDSLPANDEIDFMSDQWYESSAREKLKR